MPDPAVLIAPSLNLARHRTETSGRHDIRLATLAPRRLWAARRAVYAPLHHRLVAWRDIALRQAFSRRPLPRGADLRCGGPGGR